jgi:hypothetical protein
MIKRALLTLLLLLSSVSAFASSPPVMMFYSPDVTSYWNGINSGYFETATALCSAFSTARGAKAGDNSHCAGIVSGTTSGQFRVEYNAPTPPYALSGSNWNFANSMRCPDKSAPINNLCPDAPPTNPCAGKDTKNTYVRSFTYAPGSDAATMPKDDGVCKIQDPTVLKCYADSAGNRMCFFEYKQTETKKDPDQLGAPKADGNTATSTNPPTPDSTPSTTPNINMDPGSPCPAGTVQIGSVVATGAAICAGAGKLPPSTTPPPTTTKPPVTTSNPDGSTVTKQDVVQTNSDGSKTTITTTTTTAADGSKTTSVTSDTGKTASGSTGSQDNPDADKNNLCKQNPNLTICRNSSVTGTCGQIVCTGDAIQCATLRAAALMQCQQADDVAQIKAMPAKALGDAGLSGADPLASSVPSPSNPAVVAMPTTLDQSGWLGGGSFFPDKTISYRGRTITLPFSQYGQYLIAFRYALMCVAMLVSFKILSGAVIRE